jgi:hypothetical protein
MKFINFILVCFFFTCCVQESYGQRKRTTRTTPSKRTQVKEEEEKGPGKLTYEMKIGNLNFGQIVSISGKPGVGYKLTKALSAGVSSRLFYDYYNFPGGNSDFGLFTYGVGAYARGKVSESIYLQAEYGFLSPDDLTVRSSSIYYPTVGGGYVSGSGGGWSYGVELLVPLNGQIRDLVGPLEYWVGFYYNL